MILELAVLVAATGLAFVTGLTVGRRERTDEVADLEARIAKLEIGAALNKGLDRL